MYIHGEWLFNTVFETKWCYLYLLIATPICIYIGMLTSTALTLPLGAVIPIMIPLAYDMCFANFRRGLFHLIGWALIILVTVGFLVSLDYIFEENIVSGKYFTNDQLNWLLNKKGFSSSFINIFQNYYHNFFFITLASLFSGGLLALFIISVELNNFAFFFVHILKSSNNQVATLMAAFYIWELARFLAYFFVTLSFSGILLKYIFNFDIAKRLVWKYFLLGLLTISLSIIFRFTLLNPWRQLVLKTVDVDSIFVERMPDDIRTSTSFQFYHR
jgi:hypothetical protein